MSLISVIVPVYKVEKYLNRCVDSILSQIFTDFEVILIDDGSPDACGYICDEYAKKDARVHVIHQKNSGLSAARNAGLDWVFANSNSEWFTFIDSDDWVSEYYLKALFQAVRNTGARVAVSGYERTKGDNPAVDRNCFSAKLVETERFFCSHNINAIIAWGKLYFRECFQGIRFPVGKIHEDEFTIYRILFSNEKLAVIDAPLYAYYLNPDSIMQIKWSPKRLQGFEALKQQKQFFRKNGYLQAANFVTKHQIISLCVNYRGARLDKTKRQYALCFKVMLKVSLLLHPKVFPFSRENYWVFETAYPLFMNCFWMMKSVEGKLRRHKQ